MTALKSSLRPLSLDEVTEMSGATETLTTPVIYLAEEVLSHSSESMDSKKTPSESPTTLPDSSFQAEDAPQTTLNPIFSIKISARNISRKRINPQRISLALLFNYVKKK